MTAVVGLAGECYGLHRSQSLYIYDTVISKWLKMRLDVILNVVYKEKKDRWTDDWVLG